MKDRLRELRKTLKLTQAEFAEKLGHDSGNTISMVERGDSRLTDANIKLICFTFDVSENWLRTGEGEMFTNSDLTKEEKTILENFRKLSDGLKEFILATVNNLLEQQEKEKASKEEVKSSKKSGSA